MEVGGRTIEARQIILAPGSSPVIPKPWQAFGPHILTTDTLFEKKNLPRRIGVIGLGAIGVEMAQALAKLGIDVHGFDGSDRMAGISDKKIAGVRHDGLEYAYRGFTALRFSRQILGRSRCYPRLRILTLIICSPTQPKTRLI